MSFFIIKDDELLLASNTENCNSWNTKGHLTTVTRVLQLLNRLSATPGGICEKTLLEISLS